MKNRKSVLSVILALAMVFTLCITPAAAVETGSENGATVTVEKVTGDYALDSEVALEVSIAGNPGFAAFDFTVKYDAGKLELTKAEKGNIEGSFTGNKDTGKVNLSVAADKKEYTEDGVLFTLTFKVKADVADGTQVTLETKTFKNANGANVPATIVAGGINDTTGGNTTGGPTTGGPTTGGNTTGGNTTGGNTTGGNTTGGNTTGGNTTGGNTTGGNTTGGNTTGGNTTGGNTTGGNTTGGNTTGGNTTGGGTTGGGTTGGGSTADYKIIEGANGSWTQNSDGTLTVRANGEFSKFTGVKVDGKLIDRENYTAKSGSTIVTLSKDYLATLSVGNHSLTVVFNDGECSTNFTVKAVGDNNPGTNPGTTVTPDNTTNNPQTGDHSGIVLAVVVLLVSGGALTVLGIAKKKAGKC